MARQNITDPGQLSGLTVIGVDGAKLGKIDEIYLDTETGRPEWAGVKSGMFGSHISLVPLAVADQVEDGLKVPYDKTQLKDAPHHDPGQELSPQAEAELFQHYGIPYGGETVTAQPGRQPEPTGEAGIQGRDTSGPTTDDAMTRSEEQLRVGTQQQESGRARLRKHVVTEQVTHTVPVSHEEIRVEREPITDANRDSAMGGKDISEEEHEITLHEERPVVAKETVPVERVRLGTETVTGEETITESVRKEQIDDPQTGRDRPERG